jgi:hypothetical protein
MFDGAMLFLIQLTWGQRTVLALGVFLLTCLASLAVVTVVLVRLPQAYFREDYSSPLAERHPVLRWIGLIAKNALGALLILLGFVLSLPGIPGQGILTILIGLMLVSFPGKRRFERKLLMRPRVFAAINGVRACFGKAPLLVDDGRAGAGSGFTKDQR